MWEMISNIKEWHERWKAAQAAERASVLAFIALLEDYTYRCRRYCYDNMEEGTYPAPTSIPCASLPDPVDILTFNQEATPEKIRLFTANFRALIARLDEKARNDTHSVWGLHDPHDIEAYIQYFTSQIGYAGYTTLRMAQQLREEYRMPFVLPMRPDPNDDLLKKEYEKYCKIHPDMEMETWDIPAARQNRKPAPLQSAPSCNETNNSLQNLAVEKPNTQEKHRPAPRKVGEFMSKLLEKAWQIIAAVIAGIILALILGVPPPTIEAPQVASPSVADTPPSETREPVTWEPPSALISVAVTADHLSDEFLLPKLTALFEDGTLPAYNLVSSSLNSQVHLRVVRSLGVETAPQVWVLDTGAGSLYNQQESLKIPVDDESIANGSLEVLRINLMRLAELRALQDMPCVSFSRFNLQVEYKLFAKVSEEEWRTLSAWERASGDGVRWKLTRTISADEDGDIRLAPDERLLAIHVANDSSLPFHIYAINATPDASILPFLLDSNLRTTKVNPGESRTFEDDMLIFEEKWEYIRIIASENVINIRGLQQGGFVTFSDWSATRGRIPQVDVVLHENKLPSRGTFFLLN